MALWRSSILLGLLCWSFSAQAGSTLRCGSGLISLGDSHAQVQQKCGEPIERTALGYREKLDSYGFTQEVLLEEWSYGPRNGMYHFLRFEGGQLVRINSSR